MAETSSATVPSSSNPFMVITISTGGDGFIDFCQAGTTFMVGGHFDFANNRYWDFVGHAGYFSVVNTSNVNSQLLGTVYVNNRVVLSGRQSSSQIFRKDGFGSSYVTGSVSGNLSNSNSSISTSFVRSGTHHAVCVIPGIYNESMMLRIAHSYAYSFKIFA
jgi:hypothetical protein